jgi:hypothetical protein
MWPHGAESLDGLKKACRLDHHQWTAFTGQGCASASSQDCNLALLDCCNTLARPRMRNIAKLFDTRFAVAQEQDRIAIIPSLRGHCRRHLVDARFVHCSLHQ